MRKFGLVLLIFATNVFLSTGVRFYVPTNGKKCLKEEIHKNVVMTGDYDFSDAIGHTTSVHVSLTKITQNILMFFFRLRTRVDTLYINAKTFRKHEENLRLLRTNTIFLRFALVFMDLKVFFILFCGN